MATSFDRPVGLAYLTVAGADPVEQIEAAADAGFGSVGLRLVAPRGLTLAHPIVGDAPRLRAIRAACTSTGVPVFDVDALTIAADTDASEFTPLADAGAALGATWLQVVVEDDERARAQHVFGALCDIAAARGLSVALEFMRWRAVRSLDDAVAFIGASGCANAALCVDALHLARSGGTPAQVAALARSQLAYVQLCDAPELLPAGLTLLDEARGGREHPGEGGLPLRELVASLPPDVALSIEVAHQRDEKRSVRERARQAAAAAHRFLASCPPPKAG